METNHENINNHCNNRTTAHISHKHVHSTLQTTLIQMMLFVWVTPQRCGRKVDRTLCLCIYGKECRIDRTLYSTLLNSTHFFSVVDRTPTHYFWSTGWEVISKSPSHYSMLQMQVTTGALTYSTDVLLNCPRKKEARRIPGIKSSANSQQVLSNILLHFFEHLLAPASNSEQTAKTFRQFGQTLVFV